MCHNIAVRKTVWKRFADDGRSHFNKAALNQKRTVDLLLWMAQFFIFNIRLLAATCFPNLLFQDPPNMRHLSLSRSHFDRAFSVGATLSFLLLASVDDTHSGRYATFVRTCVCARVSADKALMDALHECS